MSRPVSLGYLTPPAEAFDAGSLVITPSGSSPLIDPTEIENWQYATDIEVEKSITVDLPRVLDATQLAARKHGLRAVLVATASKTGIQRASEPVPLKDGENVLSLRLKGSDCGGDLRLRAVVTSGSATGSSPLAPRRPGAVLWTDESRVFLEGDQSRFPTEAVSFAQHPSAPSGAAWYVDIDTTDLAAPALGVVRLLINSDHAAYARLRTERDSSASDRTREYMRYDVARQLVTAALMADEFGPFTFNEGSIGWVLRTRLANYFGMDGDQVEPLRARWRTNPSEVDAELQALFDL